MRVVGLVPARQGSKGVPGKNTRLLAGRPLLAYTARAGLAANSLDRVVLSTEDPAIAAIGREAGLEVPALRPAELAGDDTPMLDVLQHVLDWIEPSVDAICLLQPTCPIRRPGLIDECIDRLEATGADAVATMAPVPLESHPWWAYIAGEDGRLHLSTGDRSPVTRRQDLPPAYRRDGAVYVFRVERIQAGNPYGDHLEAIIQDPAATVNIDTLEDWSRAEHMLRQLAGP